jgi:hypothetical protein
MSKDLTSGGIFPALENTLSFFDLRISSTFELLLVSMKKERPIGFNSFKIQPKLISTKIPQAWNRSVFQSSLAKE